MLRGRDRQATFPLVVVRLVRAGFDDPALHHQQYKVGIGFLDEVAKRVGDHVLAFVAGRHLHADGNNEAGTELLDLRVSACTEEGHGLQMTVSEKQVGGFAVDTMEQGQLLSGRFGFSTRHGASCGLGVSC